MSHPLDLLSNKNERIPSFLSNKVNTLVGASLGFGAACFANWGLRRPIFSGIQNHIGYTVIGGSLAYYFDQKRQNYLAEKDAVHRHYVELHPEDFPTPERKKWGEVLVPWIPIR